MPDSKPSPNRGGAPTGPAKQPASPCPIPSKQLLAALTASDVSVRRLQKILSTASGQEAIFSTVEYVAQILHHFLSSAPWLAIRARLAQLRASDPASSSSPPKPQATSSDSPLLILSSLITETRYNIRLFGLIPLWIWGSNTIKNPPPDRLVRILTYAQITAIVGYQGLENVAYLASRKVLSKRFVDRLGGIDKCWFWSTRMWFVYICFQVVKIWRQHGLRRVKDGEDAARHKLQQSQAKTDEEKKGTVSAAEQDAAGSRAEVRAMKKSLVGNLLWGPLALHWSVEKGIGIPKPTISCVSFLAGAWELLDQWNVTAPS